MIKKVLRLLLFFTFVSSMQMHKTTMSGTIKDGGSGMSLPGATVLVREQQMGNVRFGWKV
jgi:hypothetical protein